MSLLMGSMCAGDVRCYAAMVKAGEVVIDATEQHLPLRHSHHRYLIDAPNGSVKLTVPLEGSTNAMPVMMSDVLISEHGNWRHLHWGALFSSYGKSPFFDFIANDLHKIIIQGSQKHLLDFNMELHQLIVEFMDLPIVTTVVTSQEELDNALQSGFHDLRGKMGGKRGDRESIDNVPYYQMCLMKTKQQHPELIVMLTWHDYTVENAAQVWEQCKNSKARYWGFKEHPLPIDQMKAIYDSMKQCGKTTFLEVVAYSEHEGMEGAKIAAACGCDILMGTKFFDSINDYCKENGIKYMPFVGKVTGRPSVLEGTIEGMIAEAQYYIERGAYGIDLLGYRFTGDSKALNEAFVAGVDAPVCLAGSIDSYERLDEVRHAAPWAFTIGGAFFENKFEGSFAEQVDKVCDYMSK